MSKPLRASHPCDSGAPGLSRSASGRLTLLAAVVATAASVSLLEGAAPGGEWWNAGYPYRRQLNLTAGATAIPTQYSVRLQLDHGAMVSAAQSLVSGNDLRVAYWNGSGWVELDRVLDDQSAWNNAATQIWFRTQAGIGASSTDDNYYLYYGNGSAGTPPTNWANVFLFYDDFNDGVFDGTRWICADPASVAPPPACTESAVAPGTLSLGGDSAVYAAPAYAFGTDTRWEGRLRLATALATTLAYNYLGASDMVNAGNPYQTDWTTLWVDLFDPWGEVANDGAQSPIGPLSIASPTSYHVYSLDREGMTSVRFRQDGAEIGNATGNVPDANLRVLVWNDDAMSPGIILDWVRVRRYVTPEPTFTSGSAQLGPGQMQVLSGTYTGNGVDDRSISVGFQPDVVVVDRWDPSNPAADYQAVIRTSTMVGDLSKDLDDGITFGSPLAANRIQSLDTQGFTVGTANQVNQNGITYYWVAFSAAPGELEVGSYAGTPAAQDITTVGFSPAYVLVIPAGNRNVVQKTSLMPANFSQDFIANGFNDAILNMRPDGFRVGTNLHANGNGANYHYLAWAPVPGKVAVGTYVGGAPADNRDITSTGFLPEWVVLSRSSNAAGSQANAAVHKTASSGVSIDRATLFDGTIAETNNIQRLQPDGFQVGSHQRVNTGVAPNTFHWAAFGPHAPQVYYRSIGTAADLTDQGTITVTLGDTVVTKSGGASWSAANRGRGDRLTVGVDHYMILSVDSADQLTLASPAVASFTGPTYTIARQFTTFQSWEDCVSRSAANTCKRPADVQEYFPSASSSLVADDRREIGIAYKDSVFTPAAQVLFVGATTDPAHTITLTADGTNRHGGITGSGVMIDGAGANRGFRIEDNNYTIEWLEFRRIRGTNDIASVLIRSGGTSQTGVLLQNLLIHDFFDGVNDIKGIGVQGNGGKIATIRNVMIWNGDIKGIEGDDVTDAITIENCTVNGMSNYGIDSFHSQFTIRNTISVGNPSGDFVRLQADGSLTGSHNTSSDLTAGGPPAVFSSALTSVGAASILVAPNSDLHLSAGGNSQVDAGLSLSTSFAFDVDGQLRPAGAAWDRGADERGGTTEVTLESFAAVPGDSSVLLEWKTATELGNLGFHVERGLSAEGPWTRLTATLIPGLGSSPVGATYSYGDPGLENGVTYFYRLEDVGITGETTLHGPVSAVPSVGAVLPSPEAGSLITYGRPERNGLREISRSPTGVVLELTTEGFTAEPQEDGSVRLEIPGFEELEGSASVPVLRPWIEALSGRGVAIARLEELSVDSVEGLRPSGASSLSIVATPDGVVRARRGRTKTAVSTPGLVPVKSARLLQVGFQGDSKKARLELAPLRWNGGEEKLTLAKRLIVHLSFRGRAAEENRQRAGVRNRSGVTRLVTAEKGLHDVPYEAVFPRARSGLAVDSLRLSRHGEAIPFHVEPDVARFGPGSKLYFLSEGPDANAYGHELVYELELGGGGLRMERGSAPPSGEMVSSYTRAEDFEENRLYQAGLIHAPDVWLWDVLLAPVAKSFPFEVKNLAPGPSTITVWLQGASDLASDPDHHVRLYVNDVLEQELWWDGKEARAVEIALPPGALREGENSLGIENAGGTEAPYSMVMLDRFQVVSSRTTSAEGGRLEGSFPAAGTASVAGLGEALLLDTTDPTPRWMRGAQVSADGSLRFGAEAGRSYLGVSRDVVESAVVRIVPPPKLRKDKLSAEYLVIGPRQFSTDAAPLVSLRRSQGLKAQFAALEDVYSEFGFGEARPEAIREFLSYAYHQWSLPRLRYVLLLGDATYDFKDYLKTGVVNQLPPLMVKTSYLWTASDPTLAAVNGDDLLPDLAIGRLPASDASELRGMVSKILAYEEGDAGLGRLLVLAADNPDRAGDFPGDADQIASGALVGRSVRRLYLHELGSSMTGEILRAFDEGASLMSYVGHGGIHLWADENVLDTSDVPSLASQPQQPLLLTMNCLNGYFHFPYFDSLSEELLKADGRGAIAAFSPSGLSLNAPAHRFHQALLEAIFRPGPKRLGDAVLKAQEDYARIGAFPELLSIYHLLGDPGLRLK